LIQLAGSRAKPLPTGRQEEAGTDLPGASGPGAPAGRREDVRALSDLLPRFMRIAAAHKSQLASEGRDRAALVLLFPLSRVGPMRQGALAELVHADPSTISRHVGALVEKGLVRRVADESDGRASRLVITEAGKEALQGLCSERESHLDQITATWDPADLATFTRLFGRLIDDLEAALTDGPAGLAAHHPDSPATRRTR
jgi:DNA-binding MarR family transcriptional regulator